jgi:hypothetical protein
LLLFRAGVGEFAKKSSKSAPSSFLISLLFLGKRADRRVGVRGGEELTMEELTL